MAAADYRHCDRCGQKAFYDADTDYGDAVLLTLCGPCSTIASLTVVEPEPAPLAPDTDLNDLPDQGTYIATPADPQSFKVPRCSMCGRERTLHDHTDYNPLQVIMGAALGWYSGDDGEVCGGCMANTLRRQ